MNREVTVVTGAAGFLGSAVAVDLCRDCRIIAIDRRSPSEDLARRTEGNAAWHQTDIGDAGALRSVFRETARVHGRIDFVVHFAAYYDFGMRWRREYERTNVGGTGAVVQCAREARIRRIVFASSIAAMLPPPPGGVLTETTPAADYSPYARSKAAGERMLSDAASDVPAAILRIGGAFSDWCELPPLSSLLCAWTSPFPTNRILVGSGAAGFPYIHRRDLAALVRACLEQSERLDPAEVLLACPDGAVVHRDLWNAVARSGHPGRPEPLFLPVWAARIGVALRYAFGRLMGRHPFERPWMLRFADRPWMADAAYTRERLGWSCTAGMGILERLPVLLDNLKRRRQRWIARNGIRNRTRYVYDAAET